VIQTLKHEVLNGFCVVSEKHLDHILRRAADWYNYRRCNSARGNLPPVRDEGDPPVIDLKKAKIVCESELGGHLKSYRAAACTEVSGLKPDGFRRGDVFVPLADFLRR
jgi:putative transposase